MSCISQNKSKNMFCPFFISVLIKTFSQPNYIDLYGQIVPYNIKTDFSCLLFLSSLSHTMLLKWLKKVKNGPRANTTLPNMLWLVQLFFCSFRWVATLPWIRRSMPSAGAPTGSCLTPLNATTQKPCSGRASVLWRREGKHNPVALAAVVRTKESYIKCNICLFSFQVIVYFLSSADISVT